MLKEANWAAGKNPLKGRNSKRRRVEKMFLGSRLRKTTKRHARTSLNPRKLS